MTADPAAVGMSVVDYCRDLPKQRWSYAAKGLLLHLPRTGLVVVPYQYHRGDSWSCVVVIGDDTYKPSGYSIDVCGAEIETATEWQAVPPVATLRAAA